MTKTLFDRNSIREWADAHGAKPARLHGTGGTDAGILRLETSLDPEDGLDHISWDEWLRKFESTGLALVVDDTDPSSTFNQFVLRE
jgi:hypothetical protein